MLLEHFERDRALTGNDVFIVVGVHEDQIVSGSEFVCIGLGLCQLLTVQNNLGAEQLGLLDLIERCVGGHDDSCRNAHLRRVMRDALRVIPGRHGHDTALTLCRIELEQSDQSAAFLEGRRELLVFELEVDLGACDGRKRQGVPAGRADDAALKQGGGLANRVKGDGHVNMIPVSLYTSLRNAKSNNDRVSEVPFSALARVYPRAVPISHFRDALVGLARLVVRRTHPDGRCLVADGAYCSIA